MAGDADTRVYLRRTDQDGLVTETYSPPGAMLEIAPFKVDGVAGTVATHLANRQPLSSTLTGLAALSTTDLSGATGAGIRFRSSSTTLASAATVDIGSAPTRKVAITGTTTITSLGTVPHAEVLVRFSGVLTLTHNATTLILPGAADIITAPGDTALLTSDASGNYTCRLYQRTTGKALVPPAPVDVGLREITETVSVTALNTLAPLANTPNGVKLDLFVYGLLNGAVSISPAYSRSGQQITWLATKAAGGFDLEPGDPVQVRYTY